MRIQVILKFLFSYFVAAVSMFILLNTVGVSRLEKSACENRREALLTEAELIAAEYGESYFADSAITYDSIYRQLMSIDTFLNVRIWLINKAGRVIIDTRGTGSKVLNITEYRESFLTEQYEENLYIEGVFSEPVLAVVVPVFYNYTIQGYISIQDTMSSISQTAVYYTDFVNICYLIFLLILLLVFIALFQMTALPMIKIQNAALEYARGNYEYETDNKGGLEYANTISALKCMAEELSGLEEYQKNFIANVSHDFRSPLTSIKGYAEAMRDGTIPYELQEKYFDVILFETERLVKLTSNLLLLNSVDQSKMLLELTTFDINKTIKDTVASFEGRCIKKRITIELQFFEIEVYVKADMSKIQQVLTNLIDNAVKFSNAESTIIIKVLERYGKVMVSVKDFGIGIPKEAIGRVFERFYKTDISRGRDKKGTGLGLAISKEIIQAHGEEINVVSTEGAGTEFSFSLKRVSE